MTDQGAQPSDEGDHLPDPWRDAIQRIVIDRTPRVLVVGQIDVGKSAFCRVLMWEVHRQGYHGQLLDADLGQKMVGPPACVTMGGLDAFENRIVFQKLGFVGTTDPVAGWRPLIDKTRDLASVSLADVLVVNTGGLLSGPGYRLKLQKIMALQPERVVLIGDHPAFHRITAELPSDRFVRLPKSPRARRKTDGERRAARREAFRHYFSDASEVVFPFSRLVPERIPVPRQMVGLADGSGEDVGLGIITKLDPFAGAVTCLTPVQPGSVARIVCGRLLLDDNFRERTLPGIAF